MSGSAAKATRREIRRAVGESALRTVSSTAHTLNSLTPLVLAHVEQLKADGQDIAALRESVDTLAGFLKDAGDTIGRHSRSLDFVLRQHQAFVGQTLWQRLRWLVTGR